MDDVEKVCTELTDSIKAQSSEIIRLIRAQEEKAIGQSETVQERLQQDISELQQRDADLQMLLHSEDDFLILQVSVLFFILWNTAFKWICSQNALFVVLCFVVEYSVSVKSSNV